MTQDDEPEIADRTVIDHVPDAAEGAAAHAEPAPPAEPPPPSPTPADKRPPVVVRGGGSNALTIVLAALLAGGIYYTWTNPNGADHAATDQLRQQVREAESQLADTRNGAQALAQQVQALADRVDKLEKAPAAAATAPAAAPDLGDLPKRVDDLSAKVDALVSRPAGPAPSEAQVNDSAATEQAVTELGHKVADALAGQKAAEDALGARLAKLEQGAGTSEGLTDRALRLTHVQAALVALQAGEKLGEIPGAPPAIARFATTAPPTDAALREAFPALAAHAREVSRPDISHRSFLERALTRLQQSVTVRQGDDVLVGDPAAGTLAAAAAKVDADDLAGAVTTLSALQGPAAEAMHGWVEQVQSLLAARAALADMAAHG